MSSLETDENAKELHESQANQNSENSILSEILG